MGVPGLLVDSVLIGLLFDGKRCVALWPRLGQTFPQLLMSISTPQRVGVARLGLHRSMCRRCIFCRAAYPRGDFVGGAASGKGRLGQGGRRKVFPIRKPTSLAFDRKSIGSWRDTSLPIYSS